MFQVSSERCSGVKILHLSSSDLRSSSEFLKSRWDTAMPITAMQKQHIFRPASSTELFISRFSSDDVKRIQVIATSHDQADGDEIAHHTVDPPSVIQSAVGDWVLVKYQETMFPGGVKETGLDELSVSDGSFRCKLLQVAC